jgi:type IV secretory pathway ATPase VirB11/archaellum biosynthesis ATPase
MALYNLIKAGRGIQLGAHYETDMFQTPRIKIMLSYHIELQYASTMQPAVIYHYVPAKMHYLINTLSRKAIVHCGEAGDGKITLIYYELNFIIPQNSYI